MFIDREFHIYTYFEVFIQGIRTFLEREIMRSTLFNNFLIHNGIHYTFLHILPTMGGLI